MVVRLSALSALSFLLRGRGIRDVLSVGIQVSCLAWDNSAVRVGRLGSPHSYFPPLNIAGHLCILQDISPIYKQSSSFPSYPSTLSFGAWWKHFLGFFSKIWTYYSLFILVYFPGFHIAPAITSSRLLIEGALVIKHSNASRVLNTISLVNSRFECGVSGPDQIAYIIYSVASRPDLGSDILKLVDNSSIWISLVYADWPCSR